MLLVENQTGADSLVNRPTAETSASPCSIKVREPEIVSRAMVAMVELSAGGIAEQVFFPNFEPLPALHDEVEARAFAGVACVSPESISALIAFAEIEARNLIVAHRDIGEELIDALAEKGELTGQEVDRIIIDTVSRRQLAAEHARRRQWLTRIAKCCRLSR